MALATVAVYQVAKYFGIRSWADLKDKAPELKDLILAKI
jgi:hypothetical protein